MQPRPVCIVGFRHGAKIIQHAVWPDNFVNLRLRDLELILAARGIVVSDETVGDCGLRFGRMIAETPKRRRPLPGEAVRNS